MLWGRAVENDMGAGAAGLQVTLNAKGEALIDAALGASSAEACIEEAASFAESSG